jgi:hypothetical protein
MSRESEPCTPAPPERSVIDLIKDEYRPGPMSSVHQAAFRQRLTQRLAQRRQVRWAVGFATAAAGAAALFLLVLPPAPPVSEPEATANIAEAPVLYAYVDPEVYSPDDAQDYLPAEYRLIANVLDEENQPARP